MAALAHFGFGFAAKRIAPKVPVGFLHWIMDLITWPMTAASVQAGPGVPLLLSEVPNIGLGLYRSIFGVIIGEGVMFLAGVAVYVLTLIRIKKARRTAAQARA